jgi:hypothetical protein
MPNAENDCRHAEAYHEGYPLDNAGRPQAFRYASVKCREPAGHCANERLIAVEQ